MMIYGFKIGEIGLEFSAKADRDAAIKVFTNSRAVKVDTFGLRYKDGDKAFSTYERDPQMVVTNCCKCRGVFPVETCPERLYPYKPYGEDKYKSTTSHICDGCYAAAQEEEKVFNAKKTLENAGEVVS